MTKGARNLLTSVDKIPTCLSRYKCSTVRGQQPELREIRVFIAVVIFRLEFLV